MADLIRVAVVGAGAWGEQHARIFAGRTDTRLVAVLGRTPERTAARAARYGAVPYTELAAMLDRAHPDLVTVCLPSEANHETTLELVRTGVPLLVEKPLAFDLADADTLLSEAATSGTFFAINFNHRYAEPVRRARAAIEQGAIGEPAFVSWRFGGETSNATSPHANLIETQCHGFDLLEHLVGPISSVMAQVRAGASGSWSTIAIALQFDNGAVGTMLGSYDSSYAYPDAQLVEINGAEGRLLIHDTVRELELSRPGDEVSTRWRAGYFNDEGRSFAGTFDRHVDAVLAALRAGEPPPVHARAGRRALELAYAVIASQESGTRVITRS